MSPEPTKHIPAQQTLSLIPFIREQGNVGAPMVACGHLPLGLWVSSSAVTPCLVEAGSGTTSIKELGMVPWEERELHGVLPQGCSGDRGPGVA